MIDKSERFLLEQENNLVHKSISVHAELLDTSCLHSTASLPLCAAYKYFRFESWWIQ